MSPPHIQRWQPTSFRRFLRPMDTSMGTARIVTDAGEAYIKAMGNRQGPYPLACEWVATQLAEWFGLPTFETAILQIDAEVDEIPFFRGGRAASGPAFVSRAMAGRVWGGLSADLNVLVNPDDVTRLVVFDTWVLNCDRHPPSLENRRPNLDNVFLSTEGLPDGQLRLIAMDHSHCFTCGNDLTPQIANIDKLKDDRFYGLFPAFVPLLKRTILDECRNRLKELSKSDVRSILRSIPPEWQVPERVLHPWEELICRRADFLADTIIDRLLQQHTTPPLPSRPRKTRS